MCTARSASSDTPIAARAAGTTGPVLAQRGSSSTGGQAGPRNGTPSRGGAGAGAGAGAGGILSTQHSALSTTSSAGGVPRMRWPPRAGPGDAPPGPMVATLCGVPARRWPVPAPPGAAVASLEAVLAPLRAVLASLRAAGRLCTAHLLPMLGTRAPGRWAVPSRLLRGKPIADHHRALDAVRRRTPSGWNDRHEGDGYGHRCSVARRRLRGTRMPVRTGCGGSHDETARAGKVGAAQPASGATACRHRTTFAQSAASLRAVGDC
jgi:hypothetical protein